MRRTEGLDRALLEVNALKFRAALTGTYIADAWEIFDSDLSFKDFCKFLDLPEPVVRFCIKHRNAYHSRKTEPVK